VKKRFLLQEPRGEVELSYSAAESTIERWANGGTIRAGESRSLGA
jgi:hypothetical protein